ncbi:hypothetical protein TCAL_16366, partial [Tigriopus californicus]
MSAKTAATNWPLLKALSDSCLNEVSSESTLTLTYGAPSANVFKSIRGAFSEHHLPPSTDPLEDSVVVAEDGVSNQGLYTRMGYHGFDGDPEQTLIATNVDDEDDLVVVVEGEELVGFCCNCGCGVGLNERGEVILEEDEEDNDDQDEMIDSVVDDEEQEFSEDEGCYLITSPPASLTPDGEGHLHVSSVEVRSAVARGVQELVDNSRRAVINTQEEIEERETKREKEPRSPHFSKGSHEHEGNTPQNIISSSSCEERRSFSSSVDSGRSSHSGTLTLLRRSNINDNDYDNTPDEEHNPHPHNHRDHPFQAQEEEDLTLSPVGGCGVWGERVSIVQQQEAIEEQNNNDHHYHPKQQQQQQQQQQQLRQQSRHHQEIQVAQATAETNNSTPVNCAGDGRTSSAANNNNNKVSVFVPYSALGGHGISDFSQDGEEHEDDTQRDYSNVHSSFSSNETDDKVAPSSKHVKDVILSDNVVICDTQVILRINCSPVVHSEDSEEEEEEEEVDDMIGPSEHDERDPSMGNVKSEGINENGDRIESDHDLTDANGRRNMAPSKNRRAPRTRASRRMTTTVAVYEMVQQPNQGPEEENDDLDKRAGDSSQDVNSEASSNNQLKINEEVHQKTNEAQDLRAPPPPPTHHNPDQRSSSLAHVQAMTGEARRAATTGGATLVPPPPRRRKKDLCKLLGLIECDVTTDATSPEDIKQAQKVALDNLISAIREAEHHQKRANEVKNSSSSLIKNTSCKVVAEAKDEDDQECPPAIDGSSLASSAPTIVSPQNSHKKDLAKFLGVDETPKKNVNHINKSPTGKNVLRSNSSVLASSSSSNANERRGGSGGGKKNILTHLLTLWKEVETHNSKNNALSSSSSSTFGGSVSNSLSLGSGSSLATTEMEGGEGAKIGGPGQLGPPKEARCRHDEVRIRRTNRKNLNKYLGLDDSDSEEMVFIQNRKTSTHNPTDGESSTPCGTGSSFGLTMSPSAAHQSDYCSGTGSSIVGIRIDCAEEINPEDEGETKAQSSDEEEFLYYDDSSISGFNSTLDSFVERHRMRSSLNNFLLRSSSSHGKRFRSGHFGLTPSDSFDQGNKKCSSLGSGSSKDDDDRSSSSPHVPLRGKTVIFKDHNNFSMEESLAQGLPVPYHSTHQNVLVNRRLKRKKKKDADRRTAEVHQRQRNPPEVLLHTNSNQDWIFEDHKKLPSRRMRNILNTDVNENAFLDMLRTQQHPPHYSLPPVTTPHFNFSPPMVSCNPKGRVKVVRSRLRPPYPQHHHLAPADQVLEKMPILLPFVNLSTVSHIFRLLMLCQILELELKYGDTSITLDDGTEEWDL